MSDGARRSDAPSRKSDRPSKMFDEPSRISGAIFDWGMRPLVSHMFTANYCRLTLCVPLTTPGRIGRKYRSVCCWDKLRLNAQTGDDHKNMMCACEQLMAAMLNRKTKTLPSLFFFFFECVWLERGLIPLDFESTSQMTCSVLKKYGK